MPHTPPDNSSDLTCSQTAALIPDYLDQRVGIDMQDKIRLHLKKCDRCRSELVSCMHSEQALRAAGQKIVVPEGLLTQFTALLDSQPRRAERRQWRQPMLLAPFAAVAFLLWVGLHRAQNPAHAPVIPNADNGTRPVTLQVAESAGPREIMPSTPVTKMLSIKSQPLHRMHSAIPSALLPVSVAKNIPADKISSISTMDRIDIYAYKSNSRAIRENSTDSTPDVDLVVHDEERGFTASSRIARVDSSDTESEVLRFSEEDNSNESLLRPPLDFDSSGTHAAKEVE